MSKWYDVPKEDISLSIDKDEICINFDSDEFGNIWVSAKIKDVLKVVEDEGGKIKEPRWSREIG